MQNEIPVFDRGGLVLPVVDSQSEWQPRRPSVKRGYSMRLPTDGPDIQWRLDAQAARVSSNRFSGQAANDNEDWPLGKLLRTEKNDHCLALAERYRGLEDLANSPVQLVGQEPADLYVLEDRDDEGRSKGAKKVTGRKAIVETMPRRNLAAPVPKKWNGDWRMISAIDARAELAILRARLAFVPTILDGFEMAVLDGLTLDAIGKRLGAGSKGAKGEARARVFDGFGIVDRFWQGKARAAA